MTGARKSAAGEGAAVWPREAVQFFRALAGLTDELEIRELLARTLGRVCGSAVVAVNTIDMARRTVRVEAVAGLGEQLELVAAFFGGKLQGMHFAGMDELARRELSYGVLRRVEGGVYEAVFKRRLSKGVCDRLEALVGLKEVWGIGILREGKLVGNAMIFLREGGRVEPDLIESLVRGAGMALHRLGIEQEKRAVEARERQVLGELERLGWTDEILRLTPMGVVVMDAEGRVIWLNPAFARMLRTQDARDLLGRPIQTFVADPEYHAALVKRLLRKDHLGPVEINMLAVTGEMVPVSATGVVIRDAAGTVLRCASFVSEIREDTDPEGPPRAKETAGRGRRSGVQSASPARAGSAEPWLSLDEVASWLGVKRGTLYKWIRRNHMPGHKAGWLWRFRRSELEAWLAARGHPDSV